MSQDDTDSIKELFYSSLKNMSERVGKIDSTLLRLEDKLDATLLQTTRTNGRVNKLEEKTEEFKTSIDECVEKDKSLQLSVQSISDKHNGDKQSIMWGAGIIAFFLFAFAAFGYYDLKQFIVVTVQNTILNK